jgi:hypothetical protein
MLYSLEDTKIFIWSDKYNCLNTSPLHPSPKAEGKEVTSGINGNRKIMHDGFTPLRGEGQG